MAKQHEHYSAEEKVSILRQHLPGHVAVSKPCGKLSLQPARDATVRVTRNHLHGRRAKPAHLLLDVTQRAQTL